MKEQEKHKDRESQKQGVQGMNEQITLGKYMHPTVEKQEDKVCPVSVFIESHSGREYIDPSP